MRFEMPQKHFLKNQSYGYSSTLFGQFMHSTKLLFLLLIGGAASDTLSVKSAAVLEASCITSGSHHVKTGSLSASTSNIDQAGHPAAGQKTS